MNIYITILKYLKKKKKIHFTWFLLIIQPHYVKNIEYFFIRINIPNDIFLDLNTRVSSSN